MSPLDSGDELTQTHSSTWLARSMKTFIAKLLKRVGLLQFDFLATSQPTYPHIDKIRDGEVILVEDAEVMKWACFRCPGGCGACLSLSLNPQRRPRWTVLIDRWGRPSVEPSIHQKNDCGCHFWIKNGRVIWCKSGRPRCHCRPSP